MEIKLGDKIKFWSVKDTVIKINGDFVDTYSYVNVPLCECELVIKKKKTSKKAIKVIKEISLLVDKLIELKKLSSPVPDYKKNEFIAPINGAVVSAEYGKNEDGSLFVKKKSILTHEEWRKEVLAVLDKQGIQPK